MRKKIDSRIRTLVENCVALRQRSLYVIVGDKGRDQVVNLHYMLSKSVVKARPSVLWCYKKDLYLSRYIYRPEHIQHKLSPPQHLSFMGHSIGQVGLSFAKWRQELSSRYRGPVADLWSISIIALMQPSEEEDAADQENDAAWAARSRKGGSLHIVCGLHKHSLLLLCRLTKNIGQHIWDVRATGKDFSLP